MPLYSTKETIDAVITLLKNYTNNAISNALANGGGGGGSGSGVTIVPQSQWASTDRSALTTFGWWKGDTGSTVQPPQAQMGVNDYYLSTPA